LESGSNAIASGGAPYECDFPVGGNYCPNTCDGHLPPDPNIMGDDSPAGDDDADVIGCITTSCVVQIAACGQDILGCAPCLYDNSQSFCPSNAKWQDIVRCAQCHCIEGGESSCEGGDTGGGSCSIEQTGYGSMALVEFSQCSHIDGFSSMFNDWDENNFGAIDDFEACAHGYTADPQHHGGKKAEDCMQILADASAGGDSDVIHSIAHHLYTDPDGFCSCSEKAGHDTPNCNAFMRFNILLRETLDACNSLDEIDCDAWQDFSSVCRANMEREFGTIDFYKTRQCDYIESGCGGAGAFPAFRRLDCGSEITKNSWDFWGSYSTGCAVDTDDSVLPTKPPSPAPPVNPSGGGDGTDTDGSKSTGGSGGKVFLGIAAAGIILGGGFFTYKKRSAGSMSSYNSGGFQYQKQRDDEMELFSGMSVNTGSFQPPVLKTPNTAQI